MRDLIFECLLVEYSVETVQRYCAADFVNFVHIATATLTPALYS